MTLQRYGDEAILINFKQEISPAIHTRVMGVQGAITASNIEGIRYCVPAYCSLTVAYNPAIISYEDLSKHLSKFASATYRTSKNSKKKKIPVCFDDEFGLDLAEVETQTNLAKNKIIKEFCSKSYRVYMLGFLPGFAYMGKLSEKLKCTRKAVPRSKVPIGSVGIAGGQAGIYPSESPGGWQIIGRTPLTVFDTQKENPFLIEVGETIKFEAIDKASFAQLVNLKTVKNG